MALPNIIAIFVMQNAQDMAFEMSHPSHKP
jgi:hypothetical protein